MGSTTQSFKLLMHDGELITCSRTENHDIFNLTMGGYGLTGLITEMEVDMVPNARLLPKFEKMPGKNFGIKFTQALKDPTVQMGYGRMNVDKRDFFENALMITYRPTENQDELPAALVLFLNSPAICSALS